MWAVYILSTTHAFFRGGMALTILFIWIFCLGSMHLEKNYPFTNKCSESVLLPTEEN